MLAVETYWKNEKIKEPLAERARYTEEIGGIVFSWLFQQKGILQRSPLGINERTCFHNALSSLSFSYSRLHSPTLWLSRFVLSLSRLPPSAIPLLRATRYTGAVRWRFHFTIYLEIYSFVGGKESRGVAGDIRSREGARRLALEQSGTRRVNWLMRAPMKKLSATERYCTRPKGGTRGFWICSCLSTTPARTIFISIDIDIACGFVYVNPMHQGSRKLDIPMQNTMQKKLIAISTISFFFCFSFSHFIDCHDFFFFPIRNTKFVNFIRPIH